MVAVILILIGLGVCGYIAGFMANIMADDDDKEDNAEISALRAQLERVEKKLDLLGLQMDPEKWKKLDEHTDRADKMEQFSK